MDFTGKVAVITGAGMGIGKATAEKLLSMGARVAALDINEAALSALQKEHGGCMEIWVCDVSNEDRVKTVTGEVLDRMGQIDILVNNAGIFMADRMPFHRQTSDVWKKKIDINILGTLYMTQVVLEHMYARRSGRIVNLSSVAAIYGIRDMVDYSMTKGAILSFTAGLAREAGPYGVTVNAVSPGNINTKEELPEMSYLNRSGTPEECANVIAFLASDEASFVSGANYVVDGSRKKI